MTFHPSADTLGKVAFSPVKSDINGNITVNEMIAISQPREVVNNLPNVLTPFSRTLVMSLYLSIHHEVWQSSLYNILG